MKIDKEITNIVAETIKDLLLLYILPANYTLDRNYNTRVANNIKHSLTEVALEASAGRIVAQALRDTVADLESQSQESGRENGFTQGEIIKGLLARAETIEHSEVKVETD